MISKFGLALDGIQVGMVGSVEGGAAAADVVIEPVGADHLAKKHVGNLRYEDISITTGLDSKPLNDWIAATMKGTYQRKNGSVLEADYASTVRGEREFFNALVTGITFPALDASSKDAASITVQIAPEYTRVKSGSGATLTGALGAKQQKKWTTAAFRFELAGLDGSKVNRIESFTVGGKVAANPDIGEMRDYLKEPAKLEFPNLKISLAESGAQTWMDWQDDFLVKGNNSEDKERNGAIVFLDVLRATELGRVNLFNCGIVRLAPQSQSQSADTIRRLTAELYCERMELAVAPNN